MSRSRLWQLDVQMLARHHRLRPWNQDDRLRIVNDHRRSHHLVTHIQPVQQKHWSIIHPADFIKVHAMSRVRFRHPIHRSSGDLGDFRVDGFTERVKGLSEAAHLGGSNSKHYAAAGMKTEVWRCSDLDVVDDDALGL